MQGQMLAARQGWTWLSTGQLLRDNNDPEVMAILKKGQLLGDEQMCEMLEAAIAQARNAGAKQIILDGFPRTMEQAKWLAARSTKSGEGVDMVVALEVPESEVMKRLELRGRMEDTPETIAYRMNVYRQKMYPVLGALAEDGVRITHLDGTGTAGEVHDRLYDELAANGLV